jgi:hypothetical protein
LTITFVEHFLRTIVSLFCSKSKQSAQSTMRSGLVTFPVLQLINLFAKQTGILAPPHARPM